MWLFALFVTVSLIEIGLFITIGGWLTLWPTLALVLLTGVLGTVLVRQQGLAVLRELQQDMQAARNPLSPLAHGVMILVAGRLLLTPGFFTDAVGFSLMVPAVRRAIIGYIGPRLRAQSMVYTSQMGGFTRQNPSDPTIIDGEFMEIDENAPSRGPSGWTRH